MKFDALAVNQGKKKFYLFTCKASDLWSFSKINQRQEDKDEGYQRVLSSSRVKKIKQFIIEGNAIPGAIVISINGANYVNKKIEIPDKDDAAWIIDGQHRSAGAAMAALEKPGVDIDLPIVAFIDLDEQEQADFFVTINREQKGVPSSLYIDLLKHLPRQKTEKERLEERIADIAKDLSRNQDSVFFQRVVSTTTPTDGQVSLTNFARRLRPVIHPGNGLLGTYTLPEQMKIIENYFQSVKQVFPKEFSRNIFFKTLGFGALWRAFPTVFSAALREYQGFRVSDASRVLNNVQGFDFDAWDKLGTGSAAETQAGDDLISELQGSLSASDNSGSSMKLD